MYEGKKLIVSASRSPPTKTISTKMFLGFWVQGGLRDICTAFKCKKNEVGTSFSPWDPNGDKFVILAS